MGDRQAADYGIDAPGVRRVMAAIGAAGAVLAAIAAWTAAQRRGVPAHLAEWFVPAFGLAAAYGFGMASYMTYGSRVGKLRTRERLLDLAADLRPWSGRETVLDVGCGRGLMLVGAARRLTTGQAVGIDVWRAEDQTDNAPTAALENARREGVTGQIRVETADARALPFSDATFDTVLSHWVLHNLPSAIDRATAINEMLRVLHPRGVLVLADIAHHDDYRRILDASGFVTFREFDDIGSRLIGVLSGGSFRPRAVIGSKPG